MAIQAVTNKQQSVENYSSFLLSEEISSEVYTYHTGFENYNKTGLIKLDALSGFLGFNSLWVKDESGRFGLGSFKVLGAAYAIGKTLAKELGVPLDSLSFNELKKLVREKLGNVTLSATTDGNHGRGVAWVGRELGLPVKIFMPKGTTQNRLNHILNLGADAEITEMNYDDTVRWVAETSRKERWLVIQDTAWEGYEDVPVWIMQGYSTLASEVFSDLGNEIPTHVFVQAGVGAFAGIIAEAFFNRYGKEKFPKVIVVEADSADCFYQSAVAGHDVVKSGDLMTIMAGLACGEQNPIGNNVLKALAYAFVSVSDSISANGMRILSAPLEEDRRIISGESGAVGVGLVESLYRNEGYSDIKALLGLDEHSKIVAFSTEGDTDPGVYRDIVWYGRYSEEG